MSPQYAHEQGRGFPIIFLHGFCETHEIWNDFIQPLSERYHVVTPDLPGFGQSEILRTPFSIDDVGDAMAAWIIQNKLSNAIVIGHSLGGYVTLSLAHRHSQLLSGIGLFHSTVFPDSDEKKENRNKVIAFVAKNGVQPFIDTFVPGLFYNKSDPAISLVDRIAKASSQEAIIGYSLAMRDRHDRSSVFRKSKIPKLLIAGIQDNLVPIESAREIAKRGQKCSFHELANTAHMGFFEAKSECQTIIERFVGQTVLNN